MDKPHVIKRKKAIDVTPLDHGIWCTVCDSEPFVNAIVLRKWSEDGKKIWFMLDTHNFMDADPDEEIDVVEIEPMYPPKLFRECLEKDKIKMANRPIEQHNCPHCNGSGKSPLPKSLVVE